MTDPPPAVLPTREGYRRWAPAYDAETPVTVLDDAAVARLSPRVAGTDLLDAGCGTGRRLPGPGPAGPRRSVGVDLVPEMIRAGRCRLPGGCRVAVADLRALPFPPSAFDLVWCRLAIGHVERLGPAYAELGRVLRGGGVAVVTDFHPAAALGHLRSFRDAAGRPWAVEHHVHRPEEHALAARGAGFVQEDRMDLAVGPEVEALYAARGLEGLYERHRGMRVVLALRFRR